MSYHDMEFKNLEDVIFFTITPLNSMNEEYIRMRLYFLYTEELVCHAVQAAVHYFSFLKFVLFVKHFYLLVDLANFRSGDLF